MRKWVLALSDRRNKGGQESLHERALGADAEIEEGGIAAPDHLAVPHPCRSPVVLNQLARMVSAQPVCEVFELLAIGEHRRETDDTPVRCIWPLQEPLDLNLVAHFALAKPDHMPFVEDQEADVVDQRGIVSEREVELFGGGHHDVALSEHIFVEAADADAAVKRRDFFAEWPERALQANFGLR